MPPYLRESYTSLLFTLVVYQRLDSPLEYLKLSNGVSDGPYQNPLNANVAVGPKYSSTVLG